MGRLSVNVQVLRNCVTNLMNQVTEVEDIILNLNVVYRQIDAEWDGSASRSYLNRLENARNEMISIANAIREYANAMSRLADQLEEQDRREEARIRALQMIAVATAPGIAVGKAISSAVSGGSSKAGTANTAQSTNLGASLGAVGGGLGSNKKKKK